MKYIIDTDPGIDDAIAIMLGIKNNLDVIGFTVANGNISTKQAAKNLKVIQNFLETDIKIYMGTEEKISNHERANFAHGIDGLGYAVFPDFKENIVEKMAAEDFIIKASKKYKDNLTIICLGPLTNLANAIKKDKDLFKKVKHIIIMGATYDENSKERYLEYNINIDPEAAKLVCETPFQDIKIVTHEIGVKSFIEKEYVDNLVNSNNLISRFVGNISKKYIEFSYEHYGTIGLGTPDPTTVSYLIDSNIIEFKPCKINIITEGEQRGECHINLTDKSNIMVSTNFDLESFRKLFKKTFN